MTFLGRLSTTGLQHLTFPRRELPGKLLAIASLLLLPRIQSQPKFVEPHPQPQPASVEPQPSVTKSSYPSPEFKIGDLVASDWEPDEEDDDAPDSATDFGEILGLRFVLEAESGQVAANTWLYYVLWTHSTCDGTCYPCYDGEPTRGCDLRLVSQSEGVK